jgi:DNA adenine methylase
MNAVATGRATRPPLRYHGGKWRLAPWIMSHFPTHRCYVEPFGGGASVLLRKPRSYSEVYNDLDGAVCSLFRVLRGRPDDLARAVELTPYSRAEFTGSYDATDDELEAARRLIVRSHMGFGSAAMSKAHRTGFRSNVTRPRTTPAMDWTTLPDVLRLTAERLRGVIIENDEAVSVIARYDAPTTLIYCDPPYVHSTRRPGSGEWYDAYRYEMKDADHDALAETLHGAQGMVVLSGYTSPLYDRLYADWQRVSIGTQGSDHAGSSPRTEVLWLNAAAAAPNLFDAA